MGIGIRRLKSALSIALVAGASCFTLLAGPGDQEFEVASIKRVVNFRASGPTDPFADFRVTPGGLTIGHSTLETIIAWAFGLELYQVEGPSWTREVRYEVVARTSAPSEKDDLRAMLKALLHSRFKLSDHMASKEVGVYELVPDRKGINSIIQMRRKAASKREPTVRLASLGMELQWQSWPKY